MPGEFDKIKEHVANMDIKQRSMLLAYLEGYFGCNSSKICNEFWQQIGSVIERDPVFSSNNKKYFMEIHPSEVIQGQRHIETFEKVVGPITAK